MPYQTKVWPSAAAAAAATAAATACLRLTGGDLELWLLAGPTPEDVSRQYLQLVGAPALPPRWALGFHQSRCVPRVGAGRGGAAWGNGAC